MDIAIPLFPRFTALDAVGPYEVLSHLPGASVRFVAAERGPKRTGNDMLAVVVDTTLEELRSPDVVVVPGGPGASDLLEDERLLTWIREAHATSTWTTSVCTGGLLLGAAGLLDGLQATTHWMELETLTRFGARPSDRRVVEEGKVITAAGVSAGLDMALLLAARIAGERTAQAIQLLIEYDPQPPFGSGSPASAPKEVVELIRGRSARPPAGEAR